jgi:hypothetical protein
MSPGDEIKVKKFQYYDFEATWRTSPGWIPLLEASEETRFYDVSRT